MIKGYFDTTSDTSIQRITQHIVVRNPEC